MFEYKDLLGKKFEYGGRGPEVYDCYGLVKEIYSRRGIELPEFQSSSEPSIIQNLINDGKTFFEELEKPEPFCLITFKIHPRYTSHIGIMLDDHIHFLHIMKKTGVSIERIDDPCWRKRITGFFKWKSYN